MVEFEQKDHGLETLLSMDGEVFAWGKGYWTKIEARVAQENKHIPHGIRYSLTLHDQYNTRVLGYDNAHRHKIKSNKRFQAKREVWDHRHEKSVVTYYDFENAGQLLQDFWNDVERITKEN